MKIYFISPIDHSTPLLFETMYDTFKEKGHEIVADIEYADVVFLDLHTRIGNYAEHELNVAANKKRVIMDFWDYGGCEDGTHVFPYIKHEQLFEYLFFPKRDDIWFVRKLDKTKLICDNVYPIELIQYPDHDFAPTTKEELFNRPYDICFIGNTSPQRESVCNELSKHFKCDFVLGQERLPHEEWLNRHRQAKFFLSSDGGGFGDERPYQLITISCFLKQRNNQLQTNPFKKAVQFVEINEFPNKIDISNLGLVLSNENWLYAMYLAGIWHMETYFNAEYRANYILDVLKQNGTW